MRDQSPSKTAVITESPNFGERNVILYGPPYGKAIPRGSGGGTGGYTRNMETYLTVLNLPGVTIRPLFHTVRGQKSGLHDMLLVRMVIDCWRIIAALRSQRPDAVHILGTYRTALPREVFWAFMCKILRIPLIYDVKAGAFVTRYERNGRLYKALIGFVVRGASILLVEGEIYKTFLNESFGVDAIFFPNFVDEAVVPEYVPERLAGKELTVLFVGYCYEGKGVVDLIEGCIKAANSGLKIKLTLIGEEEERFRSYLDRRELPEEFHINRLGRRNHAEVRDAMLSHDIFCFPSRHIGEGHSNAINEAMMSGMVIACTRHGFLENVVGEEGGYLMDAGTADEVKTILGEIVADPATARVKAAQARRRLLEEFTSKIALRRLENAHLRIFNGSKEMFRT